MISIFEDYCKGTEDCGICIAFCPKKVLGKAGQANKRGYTPPAVKDIEMCTSCGNCMVYCPDMAISVCQERKG